VQAVRNIDFYVESGTLFAFLGPNGAGKSTTIDMIATMLKPDEGLIEIDGLRVGKDDAAIRERIGIVFQDSLLDGLLSVRENLMTRGSFYGLKCAELPVRLRLPRNSRHLGFMDRPYGKLSGGQRAERYGQALVNTPKIHFWTNRRRCWNPQTERMCGKRSANAEREWMTVFLTTHYMEEAHRLIMSSSSTTVKSLRKHTYRTERCSSADTLRMVRRTKPNAIVLGTLRIPYRKNGKCMKLPENTMEALPIIDGCRANLEMTKCQRNPG
jgi:multidrug/hemolysin transport system ATP-binding protein